MEEGPERWVGYMDWRSRPALRGKHGGYFAASFVLVVEIMENLAYLANASNVVTYLTGFMHFSPARSANTVTNFMGTAFLLALLGGFLSDAFFTTYHIYLISALIEFVGLVILTVQAKSPALQPKADPVSGAKAVVLFAGLYLVALGVGGIKGSLPAHGAEQFDEDTLQGRKARSTFFNYFIFCLSCGGLIAVTLVVWVEDNKGWQWGFGVSTVAILLSIPVFLAGSATYRNKIPAGSPLTTIAKVIAAATFSSTVAEKQSISVLDVATSPSKPPTDDDSIAIKPPTDDDSIAIKPLPVTSPPSTNLSFFNRALHSNHISLLCTTGEVEDVKIIIKILPIFLSTIMLNCCLAQLSTFSVQQAATMNTRIGRLTIPPASLPVFPIIFIMLLAPIYNHLIAPFARRATGTESGITHLQRIGAGLSLSVAAMAVAALVEVKRKHVARDHGMMDSIAPLPVTFFWVAMQYLCLGSADLFTLAGLLEFFFTEAPVGMRSLATALTWASLAMGYYLSSVLVTVVNGATGSGGGEAWLEGKNLNYYKLEKFYWLMCGMSAVNFGNYLFWATRYKYRLGRGGNSIV